MYAGRQEVMFQLKQVELVPYSTQALTIDR